MRIPILLLILFPIVAAAQPVKKVLLIGIDGCRVDALEAANTPNIDGLIANGLYSPDALTIDVTKSGPGWSAMLTGVWSDKHLVSSNDFSTNNYAAYPTIFEYIEQYDSNMATASVVHWYKINTFIVQDDADYSASVGTDSAVALHVDYLLSFFDPDVLFIHFDDTDITGHSSGFSTANPAYMLAIERTDQLIGNVLASLQARATFPNEDWLVMVSTDHGGIGTTHGGNTIEERNIFVVVSGSNLPTQVIEQGGTPVPPYRCKDSLSQAAPDTSSPYCGTPRTVDLPYTALAHLCIPIDTAWELDGVSLIPFCDEICSRPFHPVTSVVNPSTAQLSWTPIPNASYYVIRGGILGSASSVTLHATDPNLTVSGLTPGQSYVWQVSTVCITDSSGFTEAVMFTMPLDCMPPIPIFHSNLTPTTASLNWPVVAGATGYLIVGKSVGNPNATRIFVNGAASTSWGVSGLTPETTYIWSARTICAFGDTSGYAPIDTFTTPAIQSSGSKPTIGNVGVQAGSVVDVFPNPVSSQLYMRCSRDWEGGSMHYTFQDVRGSIITHGTISEVQCPGTLTIPIGELSPGLYVLHCFNGGVYQQRKIILK